MLGILLAALAVLVCSTFGQWVTVGVFVGLTFMWVQWKQHRLNQLRTSLEAGPVSPVNSVWVMVGMLAIGCLSVAWRVPDSLGDGGNSVAVGVDALAHFGFLSSLMLWSLRPSRGHLLMPFLGLAVVLLCVASGGVSRSLQAQTTVGVLTCLGFVSATKIVFPERSSFGTTGQTIYLNEVPASRGNIAWRQRRSAIVATATVLTMVTGAVASVTEQFLPAVQDNLQKRLQSTIEAVEQNRVVGGMRYVRGSSLGSVRQHLMMDPQAVVMSVYADQRPGYLRGNVFDHYRESRWFCHAEQISRDDLDTLPFADRNVSPSGRGRIELKSNSTANLNRFQLAPVDWGRQAQMEIVGDPMRGNSAFLPLGTRWIEASSYSLTVTSHQSIRVGVDTGKPYVIGAESGPTPVTLTPKERMMLTEIDSEQREMASLIADSIFKKTSSTTEKAAAITNFFHSKFSYGLDSIDRPRNADPVLYFLKNRHPAHCEYFATASVLLLRAAGVPTRYVVGYVVDEESDDSGRWVARNRDAHAWVEAYDDQKKSWFAIESTPGRSYQSVSPPDDLASQSQVQEGRSGDADSAGGIRGFLASFFGYLFSLRATDTFYVLFRYAQIAVLIGLVVWLVGRIRRANESQSEAAERACRKMLARVDQILGRKGFERAPSESLHQFANRVEQESLQAMDRSSAAKREQLLRATRWLREFADARYQGLMPQNWAG